MKKLILTIALLSAQFAAGAKNAENCGTPNQWPIENQSGWFFFINYDSNYAFVIKHESKKTRRSYDYTVTQTKADEYVLTSQYQDTLKLSKTGRNHYRVVYSKENEMSQTFTVKCFERKDVVNIPQSDSLFPNLKSLSLFEDKEKKFFFSRAKIEFSNLAQVLQRSISQIGDWEDVILSPKQAQIIDSGMGLNESDKIRFQQYKLTIAEDMKNTPGLKHAGYLFARDWYSGVGTIAFVLADSSNSYIVVVPFEFEANARFGDESLDDVYGFVM